MNGEINPSTASLSSFATPGNLSLLANNGDMHAGILTLNAGNFVFDQVNDPGIGPRHLFRRQRDDHDRQQFRHHRPS